MSTFLLILTGAILLTALVLAAYAEYDDNKASAEAREALAALIKWSGNE